MSGLANKLREAADADFNTREWRVLMREAAAEIERLRARVEKLERMDREAATYVESVICMQSNRFTAEPPYVGWKGLGLALSEDYEELKRLRDGLKELLSAVDALPCDTVDPHSVHHARAALEGGEG